MSRPQQQRIAAAAALARRRWVVADFTPTGVTPVPTVPPKTCLRCSGFGYLAGPDGDPTRLSVCPGCHGVGRPPDGPDAVRSAADFRATVLAFVHARFESARRELHPQPAVRVVLDAGEAFATGCVKDLFARIPKETDVANQPNQTNPGQPANQAGQPQHVTAGSPGNLFTHLSQLAQQLRAKDFAGALATFVDVLNHLSQDWGAVPAAPANLAAAPGGGGADQCAAQLEQFVQQHGPKAQAAGAGAGAIPWDTLIPLLLTILQSIFSRK